MGQQHTPEGPFDGFEDDGLLGDGDDASDEWSDMAWDDDDDVVSSSADLATPNFAGEPAPPPPTAVAPRKEGSTNNPASHRLVESRNRFDAAIYEMDPEYEQLLAQAERSGKPLAWENYKPRWIKVYIDRDTRPCDELEIPPEGLDEDEPDADGLLPLEQLLVLHGWPYVRVQVKVWRGRGQYLVSRTFMADIAAIEERRAEEEADAEAAALEEKRALAMTGEGLSGWDRIAATIASEKGPEYVQRMAEVFSGVLLPAVATMVGDITRQSEMGRLEARREFEQRHGVPAQIPENVPAPVPVGAGGNYHQG